MSTFSLIVVIVIVLHLVVGFGWLIFKLSPRKEDKTENDNTSGDMDNSI